MSDRLAYEISELPQLNRAQLRAKWRAALKQEPPAHLRKQLLVPLLAYKLPEQEYGGLKPETKRRLHDLATASESDPQQAMEPDRARNRSRPARD